MRLLAKPCLIIAKTSCSRAVSISLTDRAPAEGLPCQLPKDQRIAFHGLWRDEEIDWVALLRVTLACGFRGGMAVFEGTSYRSPSDKPSLVVAVRIPKRTSIMPCNSSFPCNMRAN